jgi:hypothetical protein
MHINKDPMVDRGRTFLVGGLVLLLTACSTLPHFEDAIYGKRPVGPTVNDMTHEVQCELLDALKKGNTFLKEDQAGRANDKANRPLGTLANFVWAVNVNLTLDVTDDEGFNPSLSFIDPLKTTPNTFTATIAPQWSEEQHRNLLVQFTLFLDNATPTDQACDPSQSTSPGLRGNLGLEQVISTGLPYAVGQPDPSFMPSPYVMKAAGVTEKGADSSANPVFGSTIDFSLVYGLGGAATWTLTHFAGPSSGNLLTAMRTHKDTLVLSFAQSIGTTPDAVTAAAKAAQDNSTRMILQRLLH